MHRLFSQTTSPHATKQRHPTVICSKLQVYPLHCLWAVQLSIWVCLSLRPDLCPCSIIRNVPFIQPLTSQFMCWLAVHYVSASLQEAVCTMMLLRHTVLSLCVSAVMHCSSTASCITARVFRDNKAYLRCIIVQDAILSVRSHNHCPHSQSFVIL